MRDIALLLVLLPMIPLALRFPHVAVLLWAWTAILAPSELLYGVLSTLPLGKIIAFVTIAAILLNSEKKHLKLDRTLVLLAALLLAGTASAVTSISDDAMNWELYGKLAKILLFAYLISAVMGTRVRIHALVCAVCLALGFDGVTQGLMYIVTAGGHKILGTASIGDNNSFALALLMALPLMYYMLRYSAVTAVRLGWAGAMVLSVVAIIGTFSRGGFIGMIVLALLFVGNSRRKLLGVLLMGTAALLVFTLAPADWFHRIDTISSAEDDGSFMGRVIAWKLSVLVALDHPIFGGGFHAIQNWPVWTSYSNVFHRLDFIPTDSPSDSPHAAHSIYFEVLGDLGFLGLLLFLALLFFSFQNARSIKKLSRDNPALRWAYDLASMIQFGLVVYCVSGAALSMAYFELFYIQLAILSRLRVMLKAELATALLPSRQTIDPPKSWRAANMPSIEGASSHVRRATPLS